MGFVGKEPKTRYEPNSENPEMPDAHVPLSLWAQILAVTSLILREE